ncbi:MAG: hypothetical protein A3J38_10395 [Gammaproteobacteria bacterium RIFCSPHIGHO2_12_FULL_45_9]|nr:MAG: hypothetical protein A3J38_10395 [Gammaproteobacteria bacterium RIFCSPHIGHO2_12_FULL_45_9]
MLKGFSHSLYRSCLRACCFAAVLSCYGASATTSTQAHQASRPHQARSTVQDTGLQTKRAQKATSSTTAAEAQSLSQMTGLSGNRWVIQNTQMIKPPFNFDITSNFSGNISAYWQADFVNVSETLYPSDTSYAQWRSGVMGLQLTWDKVWQFYGAYNFSTYATDTHYNWRSLNISYLGIHHVGITVGQIAPYFGLENDAPTADIWFLELALPNYLYTPPYAVGALVFWDHDPVTLAFSVFGPRFQTWDDPSFTIGGAFNATYAPIHEERKAFALNTAVWAENAYEGVSGFGSVPEVLLPGGSTDISTGSIDNTIATPTIDFGVAGTYGSFSIEAEYLQAWVTRTQGLSTLAFNGYFAAVSYLLTGESEVYNLLATSFVGISKVRHPYGAFQLVARVSGSDLSDQDIEGGHQLDWTMGLNWYPINNFIVMFNYIRNYSSAGFDNNQPYGNTFATRLELLF